jgi:putative peptidoglycan lipid II flippase
MSSRLQVRKIFIYQAFTPLIYNGGIILARSSCTA